jgi:hypothetical protein
MALEAEITSERTCRGTQMQDSHLAGVLDRGNFEILIKVCIGGSGQRCLNMRARKG